MARTQVAIVGAGPSGLLLSQLLHLNGVDNVVLERQSREYVAGRIRAGVLEQGTVELLLQAQVGERMLSERLVHDGFALGFAGTSFRVDLKGLTGSAVSVYGQTEVTKDLTDARIAAGAKLIFDAADVAVEGIDRAHPAVRYTHGGRLHELTCDFVAGCDGYHGVCRRSVPQDRAWRRIPGTRAPALERMSRSKIAGQACRRSASRLRQGRPPENQTARAHRTGRDRRTRR